MEWEKPSHWKYFWVVIVALRHIYQYRNSRNVNIDYISIIRELFFCHLSPLRCLSFVIPLIKFKFLWPLKVLSKINTTFDFYFYLRSLENQSTFCSCWELKLGSQHTVRGSQLPVTLVPVHLTPFGLFRHCMHVMHIYAQAHIYTHKHTHKINKHIHL